jgi:hypothetical protein
MNYNLITDVPEVILEFYHEVVKSEPTGNTVEEAYTYFDENGEQTAFTQVPEYVDVTYIELLPRPETKTQADLDRVIGLGKPAKVVNLFTVMVNLGVAWDWCNKYITWLEDTEAWDNWVAPIPELDDEGNPLPVETKPDAPVEPVRFPDVVDTYARTLFKAERATKVSQLKVTVDGMEFDADETSHTDRKSVV